MERIVHSTADAEYADLTKISSNFVKKSLKALQESKDILTDINMVKVGINSYSGEVKCTLIMMKPLKLQKIVI